LDCRTTIRVILYMQLEVNSGNPIYFTRVNQSKHPSGSIKTPE